MTKIEASPSIAAFAGRNDRDISMFVLDAGEDGDAIGHPYTPLSQKAKRQRVKARLRERWNKGARAKC